MIFTQKAPQSWAHPTFLQYFELFIVRMFSFLPLFTSFPNRCARLTLVRDKKLKLCESRLIGVEPYLQCASIHLQSLSTEWGHPAGRAQATRPSPPTCTSTLAEPGPPSPFHRCNVWVQTVPRNNPPWQWLRLSRTRPWRAWWSSAATAAWARRTACLNRAAHPVAATPCVGGRTPPAPPGRPVLPASPAAGPPWRALRCAPAWWLGRTVCRCPDRCLRWPPHSAVCPSLAPCSTAWR